MTAFFQLFFCLLFSGIITDAAASAAAPTYIHAQYNVLKDNMKVATINETYTRAKDSYVVESTWKAVGLLAMFKAETIYVTSTGNITAQGLQPITYIHKRKLDSKRNARSEFDWRAQRITLTDRAGTRTLPLPAGTQDRLSAMYQFLFAKINESTNLEFSMTNGSKVDIYSYQITPKESVTVPLGKFKAIYLASPKRRNENRTEIWLATEHFNFPYKVILTESEGGSLTQVLTHFELKH